jgi:hypothetical protein
VIPGRLLSLGPLKRHEDTSLPRWGDTFGVNICNLAIAPLVLTWSCLPHQHIFSVILTASIACCEASGNRSYTRCPTGNRELRSVPRLFPGQPGKGSKDPVSRHAGRARVLISMYRRYMVGDGRLRTPKAFHEP